MNVAAERDHEAEAATDYVGMSVPSYYEVVVWKNGCFRPVCHEQFNSVLEAKEWIFYHPGRRYWLREVRRYVGWTGEFDTRPEQEQKAGPGRDG